MLKLIFAAAAVLGSLLGGPAVQKAAAPSITTESVCPKIYAPVICDKDRIYVNQCLADQRHATNCVPYFEP